MAEDQKAHNNQHAFPPLLPNQPALFQVLSHLHAQHQLLLQNMRHPGIITPPPTLIQEFSFTPFTPLAPFAFHSIPMPHPPPPEEMKQKGLSHIELARLPTWKHRPKNPTPSPSPSPPPPLAPLTPESKHSKEPEPVEGIPTPESMPVEGHPDKEPDCKICLSDFEVDQDISTIPCFHLFHTKCLKPWLENHRECPICKTEVHLI